MPRTIIIGDIHGMLPELETLLALVGLTTEDTLVSVGDLVDKGPDSPGVVRHMRLLRDQGYHVILVLGNHEEKHTRYRKERSSGVIESKLRGADEMAAITDKLSVEDIEFLESAVMFHRIPEHNALVVHAGILPDMDHLPDDPTAITKGELDRLQRILRVRFVTRMRTVTFTLEVGPLDAMDHEPETGTTISLEELSQRAGRPLDAAVVRRHVRPAGSFVSLGKEDPVSDVFWAEVYDGRFGQVYFGHNPYPDAPLPVQFPHATGLDLGCVFGGKLAAVILEADKAPESVTIQAGSKYAKSYWED